MKELMKKFIPSFLVSFYHLSLAFLGALIYRFPSRKLKVIAMTGTNGKSTVAEMATKILEETGYKIALISSIKFKIGEKEWPNDLKMTMPGRFKIQKFLRQAVNAGCQYAVLEVTSEGIKQHRHRFINFEAAVFTNLTPEHIEAHGSFEKYRQAKGKLFQATKKIHIINLDDENAKYFLQFPAKEKYGYSLKLKTKNEKLKTTTKNSKLIQVKDYQLLPQGLKFSINRTEFNLKLLGEFNIYNSLAAICVGVSQEISLETCKSVLEKIKGIPGRMEMVISKPFKVFIDYAFTPNALQKVYETLSGITNYQFPTSKQIPKSQSQKPKLVCVLGAAGGGRDKWKRPILGELAAKYCDEIIVTNEDPYDEDPYQILSMIKSGITNYQPSTRAKLGARPVPHRNKVSGAGFPISKFYEILDRRKAIKKSLELAKSGDMVVITGKGCEPWICVAGGKKIPWDDRKVVKEEFKKLNP